MRPLKVVFVLPPYDVARSLGSRRKMSRGYMPSLGVGYLAASLEARGHTASLIDAQIMALDPAEAAEAMLADNPDVAGISAISIYAPSAYAVARELKARAPRLPVVLGGPHAISFHAAILDECPEVDIVVPGEAERTLADLVDRLSQGAAYDDLPGLLYRGADGQIVNTGPAPALKNLDELPHPARHIYERYLYRPLPNQARRSPSTSVITSRGCAWGKCTFCYQSGLYSPRFRRRSPANVVEELAHLVRERGFREVAFWDDTFLVNPPWIEEFCDLLDAEKLDLTWSCYGRVNVVTREMLQRVARSGCYNVYYGFESGVQETLDFVNKGITLEQMRNAMRWAREAGLEARGSFILGFPKETREMAMESVRFACKLNADWMMFFPFRLQPGTAIEAIARQEGRVLELEHQQHFPQFLASAYTTPEELHQLVRWAYMKYYLRPRYWMRALWNCRHPAVMRNYMDAFLFWLDMVRSSGLIGGGRG